MKLLSKAISCRSKALILLTVSLLLAASSQSRGQAVDSNPVDRYGNSLTLIANKPEASTQPDRPLTGVQSSCCQPFVLADLIDDIRYLIRQPDFYAVAGGVGISPSALKASYDSETPSFTEMWGASPFADQFFELGEGMGSASYTVAVSALCYSIGKICGLSGFEDFGSHLLRAQAINGLVTVGLKGAVNRTRPDGAPYSYPSGHTSTAFTNAGVIYSDLGSAWGIPAFGVATYIGFSRLQENKHYLSDVIAGAVVGTYVAYKVTHRQYSGAILELTPNIGSRTPGASVTIRF